MTDNPQHRERQDVEPPAAETSAAADVIYLPDDRQRTKKPTSGSENRRRRHIEQFRTDDTEHQGLHERLRAGGLSLGEYVMQIEKIGGEEESRPRGRGCAAVDAVALEKARADFNRAANNLNQIARGQNEFLLIAHERSDAELKRFVLEQAAAIRAVSAMFAEPVAAIKAALNYGGIEP